MRGGGQATAASTTSLERVRTLARVLDSAVKIPGTNIRFGVDPLVGLIPGLGDIAGALLSGYIVLVATRLGASAPVVARMLLNIAIDTILGSVPVLGDMFDVAWKSNQKNVALLERHVGQPVETRRASRWIITLVVLAAIVVLVLAGVGIVALLRALLR